MRREGLRCPEHGADCAVDGRAVAFRCTGCDQVKCGQSEGGHDADDPEGNGLCDDCWLKREKKRRQRT